MFQTADMEILAAWYSEARNRGRPVVVMVEHMERCSITALGELVVLLRYLVCQWMSDILSESSSVETYIKDGVVLLREN